MLGDVLGGAGAIAGDARPLQPVPTVLLIGRFPGEHVLALHIPLACPASMRRS